MWRLTSKVSCSVMVAIAVAWTLPAAAFEAQIKLLAGEVVPLIEGSAIGKVAVVDFLDLEGKVTLLGRFLAEEMSNALMQQQSALVVIDRNHLGRILEEQKLSVTGLVNPSEARHVGRIAGVQAFVFGTLTPLGDEVRLTVKVIDSDRAHLVATGETRIARVGTIDLLLQQGLGTASEASSASHAGSVARPAVAAGSAQVLSQEQKRFLFELQRCELSGQTAECILHIRNDGKERVLSIGEESVLFDDNGNKYTPSRAELANSRSATGNDWRWGTMTSSTLLYDIPVRAAITFEDLSPQASGVASLKLKCKDNEEDRWFDVSFTNIPFTARQVEQIEMGEATAALSSPGGASSAGGPSQATPAAASQPRSIEETVEAEVNDLAGEAVRRAGQSLLRLFRGKKKKPADDEDPPDG